MFGDLLERESECRCDPAFEGDRLVLDGDDCPGEGWIEAASMGAESARRAPAAGEHLRRDVVLRHQPPLARCMLSAVTALIAACIVSGIAAVAFGLFGLQVQPLLGAAAGPDPESVV